MIDNMHNKSSIALESLSRYFIQIAEGERIETISEFLEWIPVSRGTIQNSIQILKDMRAIEVESRGKLGSYLIKKNIDTLMHFSHINFLVGVMPLPYSKLYEGLASGILETLEQNLNIPVSIAHMRGAKSRIKLVEEGRYDFAVVSKFAALSYMTDNKKSIDIVTEFGEETYVKEHMLLKRKNINQNKSIKVGIDYQSLDQVTLTELYFANQDVDYVPINYFQIKELMYTDVIDMAIWNGDEIDVDFEKIELVSLKDRIDVLNENTEAVIVVSQNTPELRHLLNRHINIKNVLKIQKDILAGTKMPRY